MTHPSPLPPPEPVNGATVRVRPVMFGETWTDPNGRDLIADETMVLLEMFHDGALIATRVQTPESAIALGRMLVDAAGRCFNNEIDDAGRKLPATERLNRFNKAWTGK